MKNIFVLPFDHRSGFAKKLLGADEPYSDDVINKVADLKSIIYDAIFKSIEMGVPKDETAILCDEIFGEKILKDADTQHLQIMQTLEKSGQDELALEYGEDYLKHLKKYNATFAKVLVRYNPEDKDMSKNIRQLALLKKISDEVHAMGVKLLIEPLIPATKEQLETIKGNSDDEKKIIFDRDMRADLCAKMIEEMQMHGIECDVWKIEGFYKISDYEKVAKQARNTDWREQNVGVIILGRNETTKHVEDWINAGKSVKGVIGFAIGRTIFWDHIENFYNKKISREVAVDAIAKEFYRYYKLFSKKQHYWCNPFASLATDIFLIIFILFVVYYFYNNGFDQALSIFG